MKHVRIEFKKGAISETLILGYVVRPPHTELPDRFIQREIQMRGRRSDRVEPTPFDVVVQNSGSDSWANSERYRGFEFLRVDAYNYYRRRYS